jgi:hypothetical protein
MVAHAQDAVEVAQSFMDRINEVILYPLITLLLAVALLIFLWGAFQFVLGANNPSAREAGQKHILYGIIGMVVMVSAYAILWIAANTFGVSVPN